MNSLNKLGICQSPSATRRAVDMLCVESNSELVQWKEKMEESYLVNELLNLENL